MTPPKPLPGPLRKRKTLSYHCSHNILYRSLFWHLELPRRFSGKESSCQCRRYRFDPWVGKIPWRRKWQNPLQYSCWENSMDRGAGGYSPRDHKESDTTEWLSIHSHTRDKIENVSENLHITYSCFKKNMHIYEYTGMHTHTNLNKITPRCTKQNLPCERVWGSNNPWVKCPKTLVSAVISSIRIDTIGPKYSNQSWDMK